MANNFLIHADKPTEIHPAPTQVVAGDLAIARDATGLPQVFVRDRGIWDPGDGQIKPRRVSMIDPECYVPGNPRQSIMNAITKLLHQWGTPGARWNGEVEIVPGRHFLDAPIELNQHQNVALVGVGMCADTVTPWTGGYGTTELVAPNSNWAIRFTATSFQNHAGPRIENITISSSNGGGGGIYLQRTSNGTFRNVTVYGFTSGTAWEMDATLGDAQYHTWFNCRVARCFTGFLNTGNFAAGGVLNSCHIDGNENGSQPIIIGSRGIVGGINTNCCVLQGCDTLIEMPVDAGCFHFGTSMEDFYSYGLHIIGALGASSNTGFTAYFKSINNNLAINRAGQPSTGSNGGAGDRGIWLAHQNIRNVEIRTRHYYATNLPHYNNAGVMTPIAANTFTPVGVNNIVTYAQP